MGRGGEGQVRLSIHASHASGIVSIDKAECNFHVFANAFHLISKQLLVPVSCTHLLLSAGHRQAQLSSQAVT